MKTIWKFSVLLAIMSLACTTSAIGTPQATEAHPTQAEQGSTAQAIATLEQTCAKVTATETLNLRATAGGVVIETLYNGEVVTVTDHTLKDWWLVIVDSRAGFAHADYLEIVPCQKSPSD